MKVPRASSFGKGVFISASDFFKYDCLIEKALQIEELFLTKPT